MTRAEAYEILGLGDAASLYDIERRFAVLVRRSRMEGINEEKDRQVSEAYSLLSGKAVEPVVIPEGLKRKVLGKSLYEWKNIWEYGRWAFLITITLLGILTTFIYTIATRKPPDIEISIVGEVAILDRDMNGDNFALRAYARETLNVAQADVRFLPIKEQDDSEESMGIRTQMSIILVGADPEDMFFTNEFSFNYYTVSGVFRPMKEIYEQLRLTVDPALFDLIIPRYGVPVDIDNKPRGEPYMMGLEITGTWLAEGLGFNSEHNIVSLGSFGDNPEQAEALLFAMFRDQAELETQGRQLYDELQQAYDAILTPSPTT